MNWYHGGNDLCVLPFAKKVARPGVYLAKVTEPGSDGPDADHGPDVAACSLSALRWLGTNADFRDWLKSDCNALGTYEQGCMWEMLNANIGTLESSASDVDSQ